MQHIPTIPQIQHSGFAEKTHKLKSSMKKKFLLHIMCMALLAGCSENELLSDSAFTTQSTSTLRTMDEAIDIAQHATSLLDDCTPSSRSIGRTIDLSSPVHVIRGIKSRATAADTLMYVINYADNQGFAIVSALPHNK